MTFLAPKNTLFPQILPPCDPHSAPVNHPPTPRGLAPERSGVWPSRRVSARFFDHQNGLAFGPECDLLEYGQLPSVTLLTADKSANMKLLLIQELLAHVYIGLEADLIPQNGHLQAVFDFFGAK